MSQQPIISSQEGEEIGALECARQNGVARDYLDDTIPFDHLNRLRENIEDGFTEDPNLPRFSLGTEFRVEERLECSREAALLLSVISRVEAPENFESEVSFLLDSRRTRRLKLELPLLKTDHELDCKDFSQREGFEIKLKDVKLPLEIVDEENNEGLSFPGRIWDIGLDVIQGLKREKLAVRKDTLVYLQSTINIGWSIEDDEKLWNSHQIYKKNTTLEHVTPPLSPIHLPLQPFEPELPSSGFDVPILSDPLCLVGEDLAAIEDQIFQQDLPTPIRNTIPRSHIEHSSSDTYVGDGMVRMADVYPPLASLDNTQSPPSVNVERFKREDLKVEGPLTPLKPIMATSKSVRFSDIIEELNLQPGSPVEMEGPESKFFEEAFGSAYERATQQVEQEKLIEADATARVDVPKIDFSKPDPPWKAFTETKDSVALWSLQNSMIEDIVGGLLKPWPGAKQGLVKLRWKPFGDVLWKADLECGFPYGDAVWEMFVKGGDDDDVIDSTSLTWKPPGLRILNDGEDDDDEIEPGKFLKDQPQDLHSLIRKRKMEFEESRKELLELEGRISNPHLENLAELSRPLPRKKMPKPDQLNEQKIGLLLSDNFSARNQLDKHLEIRGLKKPKTSDSSYFPKARESQNLIRPKQASPQQRHTLLPIRKSPLAQSDPLPAPDITIPSAPIHIIMSSAMCRKREVLKTLERTLPTLTIVERDFSTHNTTTWQRGSVSRSPVTSPLAAEADFIVSPTVGIIVTTLQKIKQKPLPGQKAKPEIRDRLDKVSVRYEKLVVLASGDKSNGTNGLDNNDCTAFSEFVGFSSGLDCNITVLFIGGGDDTLSKWLMSLIIEHRIVEELLPDETYWEIFLRRAGMNAFAAQSVVASLKAPAGIDMTSPSKAGLHGLTSFVEMGTHERIVRFKHICGVKLLKRVGAVVDARWDMV